MTRSLKNHLLKDIYDTRRFRRVCNTYELTSLTDLFAFSLPGKRTDIWYKALRVIPNFGPASYSGLISAIQSYAEDHPEISARLIKAIRDTGHDRKEAGSRTRQPSHEALVRNENMNTHKVDEAVLALLYLGRHSQLPSIAGEIRSWKSFDWSAMERLHQTGMISNLVGKNKSVVFTPEGLEQAEQLFYKFFGLDSFKD